MINITEYKTKYQTIRSYTRQTIETHGEHKQKKSTSQIAYIDNCIRNDKLKDIHTFKFPADWCPF